MADIKDLGKLLREALAEKSEVARGRYLLQIDTIARDLDERLRGYEHRLSALEGQGGAPAPRPRGPLPG